MSDREQEYRKTLESIYRWMYGDQPYARLQPMSPQAEERMLQIIRMVLDGATLDDAISRTDTAQ